MRKPRTDEDDFRLRFQHTTLITMAACVALIVIAVALMVFLQLSLDDTLTEQLTAEAQEYRNRVLQQLDKDMQTLHTLAAFVTCDELYKSENFGDTLLSANQRNDFVCMAFFPNEEEGVMASLTETRYHVSVSSLSDTVQASIRRSFAGEDAISRMYESILTDQRTFVYSVPVWRDGEVIGVLAANDHMEIFDDIINNNDVLGAGGYIHLIGSEGKLLVRSSQQIVHEEIDNIFAGYLLDDSERERLLQAMANGEEAFTSFRYEGEQYRVLLEPVGLNGWYLFCVSTRDGLSATAYQTFWLSAITLGSVLALCLIFVLQSSHLMRRSTRELRYAAYHDRLTGAENATRFRTRLADEVSARHKGAVAALNIRQFKYINELFGTRKSDELLRDIKKALERLPEDCFFCRDSADLFYLYLSDADAVSATNRVNAVFEDISNNTCFSDLDYDVRLYSGVVVYEGDSTSAETLMNQSLFALASARDNPTNSIWLYNADLHERETLENYVESRMNQALANDEFHLYLQPKIRLSTGALGGAEALVRWHTPDGRTLAPGQFIPIFERNGFCTELDMYMIEQVCRQLRAWMDEGLEPLPLSVNQSRILFLETGYAQRVRAILQKYDVPPSLLTLEILEGLALENPREMNAKVEQLHALGCRVSLDDFGSGYSSLNVLGNLNIDELKLDRGFLMEALSGQTARFRTILTHIVRMTRELCISTVAEGVETLENEHLVQTIGCDYGQGYYYSKPISAEMFTKRFMRGGL